MPGPMVLANVLLVLIFSRLAGGYVYFGYGQGFLAALVSGLVWAAIGFAVVVAVFSFLAMFQSCLSVASGGYSGGVLIL